jgi:hypothetical protein
MDKARSDVLVVGAGVCGLTTGIRLLEAGLAVQIWTAAYPASTTSAAAGAYWSPFLVGPSPRLRAWAAGGYRVLTELAADPRTGIRTGTCRRASRGNVVLPWWSDIPADLGDCSPTELPDLFWGTVGGMGLLGHILEVELTLHRIPSPWILMESQRVPNIHAFLLELGKSAPAWPMTMGWIDCLNRGRSMGRGIMMAGRWATAAEAPPAT